MLLRRSLVCREGGGAPVAYGIHISGKRTYREPTYRDLTRCSSDKLCVAGHLPQLLQKLECHVFHAMRLANRASSLNDWRAVWDR
jgi:hypothetical protein